ncbi:hypothetical protein Pth03_78340 [Planotetraspora thailandica]|uniref:Uncharacterized protein n=1 Tax=Planotetraspora thailandica TaxID=487172 RepID=A0A8J4DFP8_9ACTN|nr:hypothetical protein Pth03_78340 [Planotetraspora thailandica]
MAKLGIGWGVGQAQCQGPSWAMIAELEQPGRAFLLAEIANKNELSYISTVSPRLGGLAVAVGQRDEFLAAVGAYADRLQAAWDACPGVGDRGWGARLLPGTGGGISADQDPEMLVSQDL